MYKQLINFTLICSIFFYLFINTSYAAAFDSANQPNNNTPLTLTRITPQGDDVPAGRQIVFQFDRNVVPVGRMDRDSRDIPIDITPSLNCEWRWLNTSALACQLKQQDQLKLATRYQITVRPGIKTESGQQLATAVQHQFITQRPKVTYTRFINWLAPGKPLLQVTFDQPVTKTSVQQSLLMKTDYSADAALFKLEIYADEMARQLPAWMHGHSIPQQPKVDDRLTQKDGEDARRVWLLIPETDMPLNQRILLNVQPGLISFEGPEPGIEDRTVVEFYTFPEFKFLGVRCYELTSNRWHDIRANELLENKKLSNNDDINAIRCSPLNRVALTFSVPVRNSSVRDHVRFTPPLNGGRKDYDPWENVRDRTYLTYPHRYEHEYQVWLPENLKAYEKYDLQLILDKLTDEFDRKLAGTADSFRFFTAHRSPRLVLNHRFGVLEKAIDTDIPLYVTNLQQVTVDYDRLTATSAQAGVSAQLPIPGAADVAFATPMQARKLIGAPSGAIAGTLTPVPAVKSYQPYQQFFIQVTPFQAHAKFGHFSSLIWVTDFQTGQPVKNAKVSLYMGYYRNIDSLQAQNISARTDENGVARFPGYREFDPQLQTLRQWHGRDAQRFFLRVENDQDIALLPIDANFTVSGSGVWPNLRKIHGHTHAWGTTAQGVYKLGDEIEFKLYVRRQSNRHWLAAEKQNYHLQVYDPQNKVVYENKDIRLSEFGAFDGRFKVPQQGAVGWYRFQLSSDYTDINWRALNVLVSDFTPAPFKVGVDLNGKRFKGGDLLKIHAHASLHAGGPYTQAKLRLSARLNLRSFQSKHPAARGFSFGGASNVGLTAAQSNLLNRQGTLDDKGEFADAIQLPETNSYFGQVQVEAAVMDDRGKYVAANTHAEYIGRDRFVGLRNSKWIYQTDEEAVLEALVVDADDQPAADVAIDILIQRREYKVARVKGPGNAYLTQNTSTMVDVTRCRITSEKAAAACRFTPHKPGSYLFIATIKDSHGREHKTTLHAWVAGKGYVAWDQSDDATLPIIAEQSEYKVGDTARYLIKNPFPGAKALISVERYGVIDSWVQELSGSTPVIEVPIKPDYLPGFYLSVLAVSPRVEKPLGPNQVDLGKPAYRLGYIRADVRDPYKQLDVSVSTERNVYKPRDTIKARIHVGSPHNHKQAPYEIAVAVVDESVLALNKLGKKYYDPYAGFNRLDALDLNNYSLISRLVGRQKFEKKGANSGGDGSGSAYNAIRNLFKFVSYWNPSIKPDAQGYANIEFQAPDNLTGWRILAWAVTPEDMMGLGDSNYKVNRDTEIRAVMPNQVIEGDSFKAGFNILNRSDKARTLKVSIKVDGPLKPGSNNSLQQEIHLAAYAKQNIWLPLQTRGAGKLKFIARAADSIDSDGLQHTLSVNKRRSLETAATYGTTTQDKISESIHIPKDIYTDVGGVSVTLAPSVIGNIDGAFKYIRDYPYYCWEQRLTRATMASSYLELKEYLQKDFAWDSARAEVNAQLTAAANFQAPNGGMVYWIPSNLYVSPYLSAYTAIAFNWLRRDGYAIPEQVEMRLHHYLLDLIRNDVFPDFYTRGMSSSVRAVALAALAEHDKINRSDIERYLPHMPQMDLFGRSHLLQAAIKVDDSKTSINKIVDSILGHASQSGGKFQFNEAWDDSYRYILATPLRSNCSILSSLLVAQQQSGSAGKIADIPFKLVRSITQSRGNRDHWENTQENVFCLNALIDYSHLYEAKDPDFKVEVSFDNKVMGSAGFRKKSDAMVEVKRAMQDGDADKRASVAIRKQGPGRLYYSARVAYDLKEDNRARINSGIEIRREYSVERDGKLVILQSPMRIKRGELVRVDLFLSVPTARHFVVVNDPVPGGLETVNTDLATASQADANKGSFRAAAGSWWFNFSDWSYYGRYFYSFYHKELRHDSARFYADYLPPGNYYLSYTAQAIAEGDFSVIPVHVEEMYDPDVYGKGLPARLQVEGAE